MQQQAKSDATRRAIFAATLDCLTERGYVGTTTTAIAQRAKISRGAMQHHFPARLDVIVAATEHLLDSTLRRAQNIAATLPAGDDALPAFFLAVWRKLYFTERYFAVLELMNACRTDAILAAALGPRLRAWDAALSMHIRDWLTPHLPHADLDATLLSARALMRGLALADGFRAHPPRDARDAARERIVVTFAESLR